MLTNSDAFVLYCVTTRYELYAEPFKRWVCLIDSEAISM